MIPGVFLVRELAADPQGLQETWTNKWHGERGPDGKPMDCQNKHWFQAPSKKMYHPVQQDQKTLGLFMQWLTGRTRTNRHQNLVDKVAKKNEVDEENHITAPTCSLHKR